MICAGGLEDRDACQGDSGGPLFDKRIGPRRDVQIGITSWGIGCADGFPGVYARIGPVQNWITRRLNRAGEEPSWSRPHRATGKTVEDSALIYTGILAIGPVKCHNNNCAIEATPTKFTNYSQVQQKIQQNFNEIPVQSICPVPRSFVCPPSAFVMSKATAWTRSQVDLRGTWVRIPTRRMLATSYAIYPGLTRLGTNNAIS
eukprot:scaffold1132_cov347-Pavlova_lutheri.AAC.8